MRLALDGRQRFAYDRTQLSVIPVVSRLDPTREFLFFQAEDGIRDADVTGVQTCALPISVRRDTAARPTAQRARSRETPRSSPKNRPTTPSSEERRVGKECRSRWSPY